MPADLDTRIRGLVVDVVESALPPPELDFSAEPSATRSRRPIAVVVIGIAVVIALVATAIALVGRSDTTTPERGGDTLVTLSLDSIPKGVSARKLHGLPVFVVRRGNRVTVFVSNPQRTPTETVLWWCPKERVFGSPSGAEVFVSSGAKLGGPSVRGLDRLRAEVRKHEVAIYPDDVILGPVESATHLPKTMPDGIPHENTWNTGPGSFCRQPVVAGTGTVRIPRDWIPQGVSIGRSIRTRLFVVRDRDQVRIYIASAQHLPGEKTLSWCPTEGVFWAPTHGETFDSHGNVVDGPAERGLDRIASRVRGDSLVIERNKVVRGKRPATYSRPSVPDPACENALTSGA